MNESQPGRFAKFLNSLKIWHMSVFSIFLTLLIETMTRRSLTGTFTYIIKSPALFIINVLLIFLTFALCFFIPRKSFAISFVTILWTAMGIINLILSNFRETPLSPVDLKNFISMISIVKKYLKVYQIILAVLAILLIIFAFIIIWKKSSRIKIHFKKILLNICPFVLIFSFLIILPIQPQANSTDSLNLADAYEQYGFAYCFFTGIIDSGIDKPNDYSKENINDIVSRINACEASANKSSPNIIFLQLESFISPDQISSATFSQCTTPVFNELKKAFPSGYLSVPVIGAGTANTEFEILTGMNIDFFGMGEYPYNSVLNRTTCESLPYILAENGYRSHAIHNYSGTFYSRHKVFSNLGFNTFTSVEYMNDLDLNATGWAKDKILTSEIQNALDSTEGNDFIYAISVQGHGKYPSDIKEEDQFITASGVPDEARRNKYEYFVAQMYEMDEFIGELIDFLTEYEEDTVLVLFGDHLPSLGLTSDDLVSGDKYKTEYVIWSNFGLEAEDKDIEAYELGSRVLASLGITNGTVNRLKQNKSITQEEKHSFLKTIQYDIFYGKNYIYDIMDQYFPSDLKMGINNIFINKVEAVESFVYVHGQNFTGQSVIYIDDHAAETIFIDSCTLAVKNPKSGSFITVAQKSSTDSTILSETGRYYYNIE